MKTYTSAELKAILEAHGKWRRSEVGGARAYLADAYLARANLARANLAGANLADADLAGAYLADADLARAKNKPSSLADHKDPETPYVRQAGDGARLAAAQRYRERHPEVPVVENLDSKILEAVTAGGGKLDMGAWHTCETTHCRAGWAIHLAGSLGYDLEHLHGDPQIAGRMIYRASTGRVPYFFATNDDALADIKRCAEREAAPQDEAPATTTPSEASSGGQP